MCAAFASPKAAVDAAVAAQRNLSCRCGWESRPAKPNCALGDYFGSVLNRAARVMAAGHGGQILVAQADPGFLERCRFIALGAQQLRHRPSRRYLSDPKRADCVRDFPPLRTLNREPGNIGPYTATFVGRERGLPSFHEIRRIGWSH